jgi:DNA-binding GntR family transcriptional regulator
VREIDRTARTPPWQQIAADLETDLAAGKWGPHDRLPSIAMLVQVYGVDKKTVAKAFKHLAGRGLIEVEPGVGHYVTRTD